MIRTCHRKTYKPKMRNEILKVKKASEKKISELREDLGW